MPHKQLSNFRILVVEDEYLLADDLRTELEDVGATVLGPVGALSEAIAISSSDIDIDGAILDTNLGGEFVFSAAQLLVDRGVPIVFTTGYDASAIPASFRKFPRCEKPISMAQVIATIMNEIHR